MAYKQQIITFITYEEYLELQEMVGDSEVAQYELADAILIIYETIKFGKSIIKDEMLHLDVSK